MCCLISCTSSHSSPLQDFLCDTISIYHEPSIDAPLLCYGRDTAARFTFCLRDHSAGIGKTIPMDIRKGIKQVTGLFLVLWLVTGCADEFILFHRASGDPLLISRRAYTSEGCTAKVKEDAARMGVTFRYVHVRGSVVGRSLLWPLEQGYACEAAIGPEQHQRGFYPIGTQFVPHGS